MSEKQHGQDKIKHAAARFEMIEGLDRAIDVAYRRLIRVARNEWERRFAGKDPSDACVSVRVAALEAKIRAVPGSGFLKVRGKPCRQARVRLPFPRLAR
jgi:hypothetical protein